MKKITLPLLAIVLGATSVNAQTRDYNKWSLEGNFGMTKATHPLSDSYNGDTKFDFPHADAGVRYMFNNKFGAKLDFGYDYLKNNDKSDYLRTAYYRASLQGVANIGRIMNFEEWTKVFNLQAHLGGGYSWMEPGKDLINNPYEKAEMMHAISGLTAQLKLTNWVALNADFTMINNFNQKTTFDGMPNVDRGRAFDGTIYNVSLGLSFYLGGKGEHADWYSGNPLTSRVESLEARVSDIENRMLDSDNDGVADYLDLEPNTPAGNMVDVKGRSIDLNKNGIPDSYESYFDANYMKKGEMSSADSNTAKGLINDGYVAVYFDFDKSQPKNTQAVDFLVTYLKANPKATVDVQGYADSVGSASYNQRLSEKRSRNVAKILEQSGISSSRINVIGQGSDNSIDGDNKVASKFARRVTFKVN